VSELFSREHPYNDPSYRFMHQVEDAIVSGIRPKLPDKMPEPIANLIQRCWDADASVRPQFVEILKELPKLVSKYAPKIYFPQVTTAVDLKRANIGLDAEIKQAFERAKLIQNKYLMKFGASIQESEEVKVGKDEPIEIPRRHGELKKHKASKSITLIQEVESPKGDINGASKHGGSQTKGGSLRTEKKEITKSIEVKDVNGKPKVSSKERDKPKERDTDSKDQSKLGSLRTHDKNKIDKTDKNDKNDKSGKSSKNDKADKKLEIITSAPSTQEEEALGPLPPDPDLPTAVAIRPWSGNPEKNQLSFREGDYLIVKFKLTSGWWKCANVDKKEGYVPSNYVTLL